jgi:hypothetical protein
MACLAKGIFVDEDVTTEINLGTQSGGDTVTSQKGRGIFISNVSKIERDSESYTTGRDYHSSYSEVWCHWVEHLAATKQEFPDVEGTDLLEIAIASWYPKDRQEANDIIEATDETPEYIDDDYNDDSYENAIEIPENIRISLIAGTSMHTLEDYEEGYMFDVPDKDDFQRMLNEWHDAQVNMTQEEIDKAIEEAKKFELFGPAIVDSAEQTGVTDVDAGVISDFIPYQRFLTSHLLETHGRCDYFIYRRRDGSYTIPPGRSLRLGYDWGLFSMKIVQKKGS